MAALALVGSLVSGIGTIAAGAAEKKNSDYQATQLDMQAKEQRASSEREAAQSRTEATLAGSRAQALAASSGGGAGDDAPTIVKLMSGIAGQGQLNSDTQLYTGFSKAAGLNDEASAKRRSGKASFLGSVIGGFGQAAKGVSSFQAAGGFG
jgi:hypothetical protein